jgi:hypothetical protein
MLFESPGRGVDAERGDVVIGPGFAITGSAAAGCDIQITPRRMRPGILHARRQRDGFSLDQFRARDIDVVAREIGAHICVKGDLLGCRLGGGHSGRRNAAGDHRQQRSTAEHGTPLD